MRSATADHQEDFDASAQQGLVRESSVMENERKTFECFADLFFKNLCTKDQISNVVIFGKIVEY